MREDPAKPLPEAANLAGSPGAARPDVLCAVELRGQVSFKRAWPWT